MDLAVPGAVAPALGNLSAKSGQAHSSLVAWQAAEVTL